MNQKRAAFLFLFILIPGGQMAYGSIINYAIKQGLAQGSMLLKAQKVDAVLRDPLSPESIKRSLLLSKEILNFASKIPMKTGGSYRSYLALDQDWITQVVIAAQKNKLEIKKFKFPVVGAMPYKGFFDEDDAKEEEAGLAKEYDVFRRKVPAFSSLGWFSDPLTSILIKDDDFLVETLFHELVHLNFYFDEQSDFNEAFATWFAYKAAKDFSSGAENFANKEDFLKNLEKSAVIDNELDLFMREVLDVGNKFYAKNSANKEILTEREKYFSWIKTCVKKYPSLGNLEKLTWNNATILSFATYLKLIPSIELYANSKKLNYKELFHLVMKRGPSIVPEITAVVVPEVAKRCVEDVP